jgi:hypothetical protein
MIDATGQRRIVQPGKQIDEHAQSAAALDCAERVFPDDEILDLVREVLLVWEAVLRGGVALGFGLAVLLRGEWGFVHFL